jgi:4'-phosphopantetheinyl transferase EntD
VEVRREGSGAPRAWLGPVPLPVHLSLSHAGGRAVAAASRSRVGVDLVCGLLEDEGAWADFFSPAERAALGLCPDALRLGFCVKEAAWKALTGDGPSEFRAWRVLPSSCAPRGQVRGRVTTRAERGPFTGRELSLPFWSWPSRGGRVALCLLGEDGA